MSKKKAVSLSIIVPAYNEEGNIRAAISGVLQAIKGKTLDYEIIMVNDGSTDETAAVAQQLAKDNTKIRVIDRTLHKGFAYTVLEGMSQANHEYITQFHGDNDAQPLFLGDLIESVGSADIITTYPENISARPHVRQIFSNLFVFLMNIFFGLRLRYYNGTFICKTQLVKNLRVVSKGFTVYAEIKVRLFKRGFTIKEIPFRQTKRVYGRSKAVTFTSFMQTIEAILSLTRDIYFSKNP